MKFTGKEFCKAAVRLVFLLLI